MEDEPKKKKYCIKCESVKRMATEVEGRSIKERNSLTQMKQEQTEKQK